MDTFIGFAAVILITIIALFAALSLQALLLRATFALMQPATAARRIAPLSTERGTQLVARAYAKGR
jgi:type II secretory pathway component PulJ